MSQQHPQQPGSGHPHQPGWATPPPPPPRKTSVGKVAGFSCLGILVFFALLGIVGTVIGEDSSSTSKGTSVSTDDEKSTEGEKKDDAPTADPEPNKADKSSEPEEPKKTKKPTPSATADRQEEKTDAGKTTGIPPKPTGADRQALLDALAAAAPDVVRYEDKAIDAARNQCSAINGGSQRLNWSAAQRFTYKDVVTTEAQGKKINDALKASGFCKA